MRQALSSSVCCAGKSLCACSVAAVTFVTCCLKVGVLIRKVRTLNHTNTVMNVLTSSRSTGSLYAQVFHLAKRELSNSHHPNLLPSKG
jgi:alpha-D-ribose 1-methylphosphonate 5-triphosphate diphosphatase PhnM